MKKENKARFTDTARENAVIRGYSCEYMYHETPCYEWFVTAHPDGVIEYARVRK